MSPFQINFPGAPIQLPTAESADQKAETSREKSFRYQSPNSKFHDRIYGFLLVCCASELLVCGVG